METQISYFDISEFVQLGKHSDLWGWKSYSCPYCQINLDFIDGTWNNKELIQNYNNSILGYESLWRFDVKKCRLCGWWEVYQINHDSVDDYWSRLAKYNSILKATDISSQEIPIIELGKYLSKHSNQIYKIHHTKMEELVGDVFKEHFDCKVIHCGQSYDRGIDLYLIDGEEKIPIQVKRRTKPNSKEPVSVIREMLGVMFRDSRKSAMLVTTAEDFSKEAKRDVNEVIKKGLVERFDLFNFDKFNSILRTVYKESNCDYLKSVPLLLGGQSSKI
jgi:restriction system protein